MENYGWSIELNPGYVLIIGNAPDAHIQLDSAYGRAVRVQFKGYSKYVG